MQYKSKHCSLLQSINSVVRESHKEYRTSYPFAEIIIECLERTKGKIFQELRNHDYSGRLLLNLQEEITSFYITVTQGLASVLSKYVSRFAKEASLQTLENKISWGLSNIGEESDYITASQYQVLKTVCNKFRDSVNCDFLLLRDLKNMLDKRSYLFDQMLFERFPTVQNLKEDILLHIQLFTDFVADIEKIDTFNVIIKNLRFYSETPVPLTVTRIDLFASQYYTLVPVVESGQGARIEIFDKIEFSVEHKYDEKPIIYSLVNDRCESYEMRRDSDTIVLTMPLSSCILRNIETHDPMKNFNIRYRHQVNEMKNWLPEIFTNFYLHFRGMTKNRDFATPEAFFDAFLDGLYHNSKPHAIQQEMETFLTGYT